jgi:hypothetical protein
MNRPAIQGPADESNSPSQTEKAPQSLIQRLWALLILSRGFPILGSVPDAQPLLSPRADKPSRQMELAV